MEPNIGDLEYIGTVDGVDVYVEIEESCETDVYMGTIDGLEVWA